MKKDGNMAVGPSEMDCMFGKMGEAVVSASLDIVHKKEEIKRNEKKEQEKEEWKESVREHLKQQEEWNKSVGVKLNQLSSNKNRRKVLAKSKNGKMKKYCAIVKLKEIKETS